MKVNVDIPRAAVDAEAKKKIQALERKLSNAEKRADKWKATAKRYESALEDARQVTILAEEIGKLVGLREEYF